MFIAAKDRKNFFGGKTKYWMAFQRDFLGQTLNKSTAAVGRKNFWYNLSGTIFKSKTLSQPYHLLLWLFQSESGNVCPQKVAKYQDFSGYI